VSESVCERKGEREHAEQAKDVLLARFITSICLHRTTGYEHLALTVLYVSKGAPLWFHINQFAEECEALGQLGQDEPASG